MLYVYWKITAYKLGFNFLSSVTQSLTRHPECKTKNVTTKLIIWKLYFTSILRYKSTFIHIKNWRILVELFINVNIVLLEIALFRQKITNCGLEFDLIFWN
jgi:hypothetical protein